MTFTCECGNHKFQKGMILTIWPPIQVLECTECGARHEITLMTEEDVEFQKKLKGCNYGYQEMGMACLDARFLEEGGNRPMELQREALEHYDAFDSARQSVTLCRLGPIYTIEYEANRVTRSRYWDNRPEAEAELRKILEIWRQNAREPKVQNRLCDS